jgi:hypothetical protein
MHTSCTAGYICPLADTATLFVATMKSKTSLNTNFNEWQLHINALAERSIIMKSFSCYGIRCEKKDEKILVSRVNEYLAAHDRTMTKTINESLLKARLPFVYKYYYWNRNKGTGTYFEVIPNEDAEGKCYSEENRDCAWIIKTRIHLTHPEYKKEATELFLQEVIRATGFDTVTIYERDHDPQ